MALIPALTMASVLLFQAVKGLTIGILFHAQSVIVEVPQPSPNSRKGVVEMAMAFALTFFRDGPRSLPLFGKQRNLGVVIHRRTSRGHLYYPPALPSLRRGRWPWPSSTPSQ